MSTPQADRATLLEALLPVAREAGAAIMEVHRAGVANAAAKGDGSPVTEADLRANRIILAALADLAVGAERGPKAFFCACWRKSRKYQ